MELIQKIWINNDKTLCVQPQSETFEYIWRSGMNIYWNKSEHFLYNRIIGSWSPADWYRQIISAVYSEYGFHLYLSGKTVWDNIDEPTKEQILRISSSVDYILKPPL